MSQGHVSTPVQVTVGLNPFGAPPGRTWSSLLDQARDAERAGVHRVVVPDHVVNGPEVADYPWGRFPTPPDGDWLEPLTVLSAMAAVTERVRLGTSVLVAPLRPPALLAATVATLDVMSGGRVDLGVGTGWQPEEFAAMGVDFATRGQRLTDTIAVCRALWAGGPTDVTTDTFQLHQAYCHPTPAQDRLPVWFSGSLTGRNVSRIVQLGDGWIPIMGMTPAEVAEGAQQLRAAAASAGRDPASVHVRCTLPPVRRDDGLDLATTVAPVAELVRAGVRDVQLNIRTIDPTGTATFDACRALLDAVTDAAG